MSLPADEPLYFDHNATTPLLPEVVEAMVPFLTTHFGNPSSGHLYGRRAKDAVERARAQVAALVEARAEDVIFTSGGTEATALALKGTLRPGVRERLVTTTVEHPATARVVDLLAATHDVVRVGVNENGLLRADELDAALVGARWCSVIHAHNETGVLQPLRTLSSKAHAHGALLHADASQSAGKVPLSLEHDGFDLLTLAAHKLYGPKGVGALVRRAGVTLHAQQLGAGHERGLRAGTENVASLVGFGVACIAAKRDLTQLAERLTGLRARLESGLRARVPGLVIAGERAPRLPNTTYAVFPKVSGNALLAKTPVLAASTGSACHDGHDEAPKVLLEMGLPASLAIGAVRLTLGRHTDEAQVDTAITALSSAWDGMMQVG